MARKPARRKPVKVDYSAWGTAINQEAYELWREYRKEIRKPLSRLSVEMQFKLLAGYPYDEQQAIIEQSIRNSWIGLFEPKQQATNSTRHSSLEADLLDTSWAN